MLTPKHLTEALQLKSLSAMWAFSDVGIVNSLHNYLHNYLQPASPSLATPDPTRLRSDMSDISVFDLSIDGRPALHTLKSYLPSITMPDNVSAQTLAIWFTYLRWEQNEKGASLAYPFDTTSTVVISDEDLDERIIQNNQVLFTRKKGE